MHIDRSSGLLLHPISLPSPYGIGDLGDNAFRFVDFLVKAGQKLWQTLPLGPTGYGDSPYQCFSAFAGNPLLISPDRLRDQGFLTDADIADPPASDPHRVDYGTVIEYKHSLLKKAFARWKADRLDLADEYDGFLEANEFWLEDYVLFMAAKAAHGGVIWTDWDPEIAQRRNLAAWRKKLADTMDYERFIQFMFFHQWHSVKRYANEKGVKLIGDIPLFIAYDSSDLWANRELFSVNEDGELYAVAGVPPDYFSETGQLWGNPLYEWDRMKADDFAWWRKRFRQTLKMADIIRIDHFRGLEAYWRVPGGETTAMNGEWIKAPGDELFTTVQEYLGEVPIIAEDLGVITPEVEALRDKFGFYGIKILQFSFGTGMEEKFLPHRHIQHCIIHTGSHDNDTTAAYFEKARKDGDNDIAQFAEEYLRPAEGESLCEAVVRASYASVADASVVPVQDILCLGNEARMNFPGKIGGWWSWRCTWDQLSDELAAKQRRLSELYGRI